MIGSVWTLARYTALEGWKNRFLWIVTVVVLGGFMLAEFAGTLALTEVKEIQSAILGAYLRLGAVILTSLVVLNSLVRELNDKGLELILSLPIPRGSYFFGKLIGYTFTVLTMVTLFSAALLPYSAGEMVLFWGISLLAELLIVIALCLLTLLTFNQVTPAFSAVLAIYLLSRSITSLQQVGQGPIMGSNSLWMQFMNEMIGAIALVLPGLDRFTQTEWLVYGTGSWLEIQHIFGQTVIYLALLCGAALFDLYRKNI
ncbi:MAG: ABC transporter permease [Magnetococcales bacterium]|nr:ABC transporter permease [Magnetococcales bacterium]